MIVFGDIPHLLKNKMD